VQDRVRLAGRVVLAAGREPEAVVLVEADGLRVLLVDVDRRGGEVRERVLQQQTAATVAPRAVGVRRITGR
jgi:hypothetical protein